MNRILSAVSSVTVLALVPLASAAQQMYMSMETGAGIGRSLSTDARDTDFPTLCDMHLDPLNHFSPAGVTEPAGCSSAASTWSNSFDGGSGFITGFAVGITTGIGARIEAEYFRSGIQHNSTSALGGGGADIQDKQNEELRRLDERIGNVNINNLVVNLYYDLPLYLDPPGAGQLRPYVGGGLGFGMAELDYAGVFARNLNPDVITTADAATYNGRGSEAADRRALHERIAGTTTTASHTLRDTMSGYQLVAGVDYMLSDQTSIGLKGRWVRHAEFSDGSEWDQLRSHESDNGSGTDTVVYTVETDDLSAFGVTLVMKYAF